MASFVTTCPHCQTQNIALEVVLTVSEGSHRGLVFMLCPHCKDPSSARIDAASNNLPIQQISQQNKSFNSSNYSIIELWPSPKEPSIPSALPENVHRAMKQAESNFAIHGNEEAAGVMYRRALEVGLKAIDPKLDGMLASRIGQLGKLGKLTPALVEWANEIKSLGNESAHDTELTDRKDLMALRGLTDLVLQYLFSIPALVIARKSESSK